MQIKFEVDVKVKSKGGLHVRPASCIAKILHECQSKVMLTYKGETVNARSIMSLMLLAIPKNAKVHLIVEGIDAKEMIEKLIIAFESRFEERE